MISSVFTLMALLSSCHTQDLIPNGNVSNNRLTENRLMQLPFQTSTEIIEESVSALTKAPRKTDQIADTLYTFPFLVNKSLLNYADILVSEYNTHVNDEDVTLSISELITKYGYPVERHAVRTEDGYNLQMFRIPNNGSVVFLMHGLGGCADDFILAGPQSGLAYLLSKEGYDVWMGNARGNKHSRSHQYLSPSDPNFWDFSWHEIGYYDLPAMIDYALGISKSETLKYIGYSQGSTVFFVMAAEKVQYNDKISIMVALSPIAYMTRVKSPLARLLSPGTPLMYEVSKSLGIYEFPMKSEWTGPLKLLMCGVGPLADILCSNVLFLAVGFDLEQLNITNLPVILSHVPAGASVKQLVHYGQGVVSGEFRQFDLGAQGNLKRYGSLTPPKYDLDRVRVPVSLFYSNEDWMAHPDDVDQLYKELHNAVDIHRVPYEHFNHIDFIFAKEFKRLIHKRLRKLLSLF